MSPQIKRAMMMTSLKREILHLTETRHSYGRSCFLAHARLFTRELTLASVRGGYFCAHDAKNRTTITPTPEVEA